MKSNPDDVLFERLKSMSENVLNAEPFGSAFNNIVGQVRRSDRPSGKESEQILWLSCSAFLQEKNPKKSKVLIDIILTAFLMVVDPKKLSTEKERMLSSMGLGKKGKKLGLEDAVWYLAKATVQDDNL